MSLLKRYKSLPLTSHTIWIRHTEIISSSGTREAMSDRLYQKKLKQRFSHYIELSLCRIYSCYRERLDFIFLLLKLMFTHKIDHNTECLISELSNETIQFVIEEKTKNLSQYMKFALGSFQDTIETISSWMDMESLKRKAKTEIQKWVQELSQYVIEAQIRWMDCSKPLQELFWRKEKTTNISYLLK